MIFNSRTALILAAALGLAGSGCSSKATSGPSNPLMPGANAVKQEVMNSCMPSANTDLTSCTSSVKVTMQVSKAALFNQQFIYEADLQYSSQYDKDMDLYNQSSAMGAWPASFRIAGNKLELVADMTYKYPSDVNHPEQLLSTYKILAQDADTLTISAADSTIFLAMQLGPTGDNTKNVSVLNHWVRSVDYVPEGNYILQQTSIQLADATNFEIMESVYPRSNLKPGKDFKQFKMSTTSLSGAGSDSPSEVSRFRFLSGDSAYTGEDVHSWSQHFDLSPSADGSAAMIDWYVTPNIPDQFMEPVKEAVEGWNRYFRTYAGFKRDVLRFKGRLPDGIHIGDPRYNVINWDSRTVAGAAYESQNTDPENGKQSHSIIYMPAAWVTIGTTYWSQGEASDFLNQNDVSSPARAQYASRINCSRNMADAAMTAASGALDPSAVQDFGVEILKQTLFHEVGHSLGLAHNFKAYTSWDPTKPNTMFSTSIMAYNDYELERAAFSGLHSSDGPLLEYDRQALSAIYDEDKDIQNSDPVLPTCEDAEADTQAGGVDPICIRYANEWDPTLSVQDAYNMITRPTMANGDVTLTQALARVPAIALSDDAVAAIKTQDQLQAAVNAFGAELKGSMTFYVVSGKRSLDYTMRLNVKSLYEFEKGVLPSNYDELGMRSRAFTGAQEAVDMLALPDGVSAAANAAIADGLARLTKSPAMQAMSADDSAKAMDGFKTSLTQTIASFLTDDAAGLPKLRLAVLGALARQAAVPFFDGTAGGSQLDYETAVAKLLAGIVAKPDPLRLSEERVAAAKALATFKGREPGDDAIAAITAGLDQERKDPTSNDARETIEQVVAALGIN